MSTLDDNLLQQPSGPAPSDNNTVLSQPDAETSASNLKTAFYTINSRATRLSPHHRIWSRSQHLAILSRQSHAGALAIARFRRTDQSWSDPLLVVLGPMAASPQGTSLDLLATCTPEPNDPSSHFSQFCPLAFSLSAQTRLFWESSDPLVTPAKRQAAFMAEVPVCLSPETPVKLAPSSRGAIPWVTSLPPS